MDTPPLSPKAPVGPQDLISADGACAEVAQASSGGEGAAAPTPGGGGSVALESTECDVVRAIGAPDNTNISADERGGRLVVLTYSKGARAGIYRFSGGRLSAIERGAEPAPVKKPPPRKKKSAA